MNDSAVPIRHTQCRRALPRAYQAFERRANARPNDLALVYGDRKVPYGELNRRAEAVAGVLAELGVRSGHLVAIALDRSPDMIAALLATLKAGAAFLPLDIEHPAGRLEFIFDDARPRWCLTHQALLERLPMAWQSVAWCDGNGLAIIRQKDSRHFDRRPWLAYAIYTSGSTGQPKAALLTHYGLAHLVAAERRLLQLGPGRRVLQFASPAFDAAMWEIFGALTSGATLVLADANELLPGEPLRDTIERQEIDTLTLPPSVLAMLGSSDLPRLQTLVVAGEACGAALASQWSVGRCLINAYGPTEATICATAYLCPPGEQPAPPLGNPLPHVELLLLDSDLQPVSTGEPGELCLAGPGLAKGYLNRPERTAEKFVQHPLVRHHDRRLYRTGDLVRRRGDGELEFLGRLDRQVKIRGVRIEPDEITAVLESHPGVHAAATVAVQDGARTRLASFAIPKAGSLLSVAELRQRLYARLPAAMIPASLTFRNHWPLTTNGKLDHQALVLLAAAKPRSDNDCEAANRSVSSVSAIEGECERDLTELVRALLGVPHVGPHGDFFEMGGDSLKAAELLISIERKFCRRISIGQLLAHSTVARLSRLIGINEPAKCSTLVPLTSDAHVADFERSQDRATSSQNSHEFCYDIGSQAPWFFVHPAGGSAACYRRLAQAVGRDRLSYGIESPALTGDEPPPAAIEAMADRYLCDVLVVQPRGPYLLAGWSLGGLVAYEMAHRLRMAGHDVPVLVLIDSGVLYSFELLRRFVPTSDVPAFLWKTADRERMYARLREHEGHRLLPGMPHEQLSRRMFETFWANVAAAYHYSPPDDDGPLTLIVGTEAQGKHHPYQEWLRRSKNIKLYELPARHLDLLEPPHVEQLAGILRSSTEAHLSEFGA